MVTAGASMAIPRTRWWWARIQGIVAIILGVLLVGAPAAALPILVQLLGVYWLVTGIVAVASATGLGQPGGIVRTFTDLGPPLADLRRRPVHRRGRFASLSRLLAAVLDSPAPPATPPAAGIAPPTDPARALLEQLTERETEVLACLQRRLTNKEIATELAISPLTVKRHVSNLCAKLGTDTRRQAALRAAAIGLLPPCAGQP
jgi:DNA-binding CsgD family transcriptional regulator